MCPLCQADAQRDELPHGDGHSFACAACGGVHEVGSGAQGRIDCGVLGPDVIHGVRRMLAAGKRPRVAWYGPNSRFEVTAV